MREERGITTYVMASLNMAGINQIIILYVDDACIISPSLSKIKIEIKSLQQDSDLTDDGELQDYIGTRFD